MPVTIVLKLKLKPEFVEEIEADFAKNLPDTLAFDGCHGLMAYRNQDDSADIVEIEQWESRTHYQNYVAWRTETGMADHLISMLAEPPDIQYYDSIWPGDV